MDFVLVMIKHYFNGCQLYNKIFIPVLLNRLCRCCYCRCFYLVVHGCPRWPPSHLLATHSPFDLLHWTREIRWTRMLCLQRSSSHDYGLVRTGNHWDVERHEQVNDLETTMETLLPLNYKTWWLITNKLMFIHTHIIVYSYRKCIVVRSRL